MNVATLQSASLDIPTLEFVSVIPCQKVMSLMDCERIPLTLEGL